MIILDPTYVYCGFLENFPANAFIHALSIIRIGPELNYWMLAGLCLKLKKFPKSGNKQNWVNRISSSSSHFRVQMPLGIQFVQRH